MPSIGQKAPGFSLFDTEKNKVSLSDLEGKKVLLVFFPLAFTSVCTTELCSLRDGIAIYNDLKVTVLGISVDSPYTLKKFKEEQGLNFTLLSDFNKEASNAYAAIYESFAMEMKGVSKRAVFVLDQQGILRYQEVLENAGEIPDFVKVQNALAEIA